MTAVHIRDLSEETMVRLKERARRNGRSMQKELVDVLDSAAAEPLPKRRRGPLNITVVHTGHTEPWDRAEIYD